MRAASLVAVVAALAVMSSDARAAQTLTPREAQRLLKDADDAMTSARGMLGRGEKKRGAQRLEEAEAGYKRVLEVNKANKRAAIGLSSVFFLTERFPDGVRLLKPFRARDADDMDIAQQLGLHLYRTGEHDNAVPLLEQAAADAKRFDASWMLAGHYYRRANWVRGLHHATRYVNARPEDTKALALLGTFYLKSEQFADAVTVFQRYLDAHPDNPSARINFANALVRSGSMERASLEYERLLKDNPKQGRLLYNLAAIRIKQERCEDALSLLDRFLVVQKKSKSTAIYFKGDCLIKLERYAEARTALEPLLADTNNPWVHHALSRISWAEKKPEEALGHARKAVEISPTSWEIVGWVGTLERRAGNPERALEWHDKAIVLAPEEATLPVERGRDLFALARYDDAIAAFGAGRDLDPEVKGAGVGLAASHTAVGVRLRGKGADADARARFKMARELAPDYAAAGINLALVDVGSGRMKEAERSLASIPASDPNRAALMAFIRLRDNDTKAAERLLRGAKGPRLQLDAIVAEVKAHLAAKRASWQEAAKGFDALLGKGKRPELRKAAAVAWLHVALGKLGRGDKAGTEAALKRVTPMLDQLVAGDRDVARFAESALALVGRRAATSGANKLQKLISGKSFARGKLAGLRDVGYAYIAHGLLRAGKPSEALTAIENVRGSLAEAAPMKELAHTQLAAKAYKSGKHKQAMTHWAALGSVAARHNRATALFKTGDIDGAAREWSLLTGPDVPAEALYNQANVADRRGDYHRALKLYAQYVAKGGVFADKARRRVEAKRRVYGRGK